MSREQMFTDEWWKERFRNGRSRGCGSVELRDEDKYWYIGITLWKVMTDIFLAVREKYGDEGINLLSEVVAKDYEQTGKMLLSALEIDERDATALAAMFVTNDVNVGHTVAMTHVEDDRSKAAYHVSWCGLAEAGTTNKDVCQIYGLGMLMGFLKAIDPTMSTITCDGYAGPPCHLSFENVCKHQGSTDALP